MGMKPCAEGDKKKVGPPRNQREKALRKQLRLERGEGAGNLLPVEGLSLSTRGKSNNTEEKSDKRGYRLIVQGPAERGDRDRESGEVKTFALEARDTRKNFT